VFLLTLVTSHSVFAQNSPQGTRHHQFSLQLAAGEEKILSAPFSFRAFALDKVEGLEVRFLHSGSWSDWQALNREEPEVGLSELLFLSSSSSFAIRSTSDQEVVATIMHLVEDPVSVVQNDQVVLDSAFNTQAPFTIVSRREWGADESLGTYIPKETQAGDGSTDNGKNICAPLEKEFPGQYKTTDRVVAFDELGRPLVWPRQYSNQIKKIVVHHTAQTLKDLNDDRRIDARDYRLAVKAIYVYHTVSNKWGDIGYHYLVDPAGNVYEGRAGGPEVIAAHVLCQNSNTVGISVMGNFDQDSISENAFNGLANITGYLASKYEINPLGKSAFRGKVLPHIVTHAEVGEVTKQYIGQGGTACPGTDLKFSMDRLRKLVAEGGVKTDFAYEVVEVPRSISVDPLQKIDLTVRLKNSGAQTWSSLKISSKVSKDELLTLNTYVSPGQEVTVVIPYQADLTAGSKVDTLVVDVNSKRMAQDFKVSYRVNKPKFTYNVLSFSGHRHSLLAGETRVLHFKLKNTGNFPWLTEGKYALQLRQVSRVGSKVTSLRNGGQAFLSQEVPVGGEVELSLELPIQRTIGTFEAEFLPMIGRDMGLKGDRLEVKLDVEQPKFVARVEPVRKTFIQRGFEQEVMFQLVNDSNFDWEEGSVWYQVKGGEKVVLSQTLGRGGALQFPVMVRSNYDDAKAEVQGTVGVDRLPEFVTLRTFRPTKLSFSESLLTRGTVRLLAEVIDGGQPVLDKGIHEIKVQLRNTGNVPWYNDGKDRMMLVLADQANFLHKSWEKRSIAAILENEIVLPNDIGEFTVTLEVKQMPKRTTYDEFVPFAGEKSLRMKGSIKLGVEVEGTRERRETSVETSVETSKLVQEPMKIEVLLAVPAVVTAPAPVAKDELPPIRVWLTEINQSSLDITSPGAFIVWDSTSVRVRNLKAGEVFAVKDSDIKNGTIFRFRPLEEPYLELKNWGTEKVFGTRKYFDNTFRNVIEVRYLDGKMTVINELPLEDYMKGIAEVPETDDQPQDKRKTIAVLARSYALHYLISEYEKFPGKPYNAANSPAIFQKYLGYGFEQRAPKWQAAVNDTFGEVVMVGDSFKFQVSSSQFQVPDSKNRVLRAAYFSCTDGNRTKTPDQAGWGTNEYFQRFKSVFASVEDPLGDDPTREGLTACGHQVGLSGYGATQMAKQGKSYREIIGHYYQGVEVGKFEEGT
jgi:hypothetical protein